RSNRNVGADVGTELSVERDVVIAEGSGMELHHHLILGGHPAHFDEHVPLEEALVGTPRFPLSGQLEEALGLIVRKDRRKWLLSAVVGRGAAQLAEEASSRTQRVKKRVEVDYVDA